MRHLLKIIGNFIITFIFLFSSKIYADTSYKAAIAFTDTNFLLSRDRHSKNDLETLDASFELLYDNTRYFKADIKPQLRIDFLNSDRNRYIPNEAYLTFYIPHHQWTIGEQIVHWGVSTFFNPTDSINRQDYEDNFFMPSKLGELIVAYHWDMPHGPPIENLSLDVMALPFFQTTPLPELNTRYNFIGHSGAIPYSLADGQENPHYPQAMGGAISLSLKSEHVDASIDYYHGPEKTPGYFLQIDGTGALRLKPFYYTVDMIGLNIEVPVNHFNFHLETAAKITTENDPKVHDVNFEDNNGVPKSYIQYVPGVDYIWHGNPGDLTLTLEYMGEPNFERKLRNFRPFQNDLFVGARFLFSDYRQSECEVGLVKDLGNEELALLTHVSTKLYKDLRGEVGALIVHRDGTTNSPISYFDNNSQVYAKVSYTFGGALKK